MKSISKSGIDTLKDRLPADVLAARAFLLWRKEEGRKIPYYTNGERRSGENGSARDRQRLVTFNPAVAAYSRGGLDGIGLALLPELNIIALDFDDCRSTDGTLTKAVAQFVDESYAEVSPSGTGVRVLLRGTMPNSKTKGVEVFSTKGYVTLTGNRLNGAQVADLTPVMRERLQSMAGKIHVDFTEAKPRLDRERILAGVDKGEREVDLFKLACSYIGRGLNRQEVEGLIGRAAEKCNPPFGHEEAMRMVAQTYKRYARPQHAGERNTDLGNARRLIRHYGAEVRWTPSIGWLIWNGNRWHPDEGDAEVMQRAKRTVVEMYQEAAALPSDEDRLALAKWATSSESAARLKAAVELARTEPDVHVDIEKLDAHPLLLCVSNGVVDLRTGRLREARPEDLITKQAPVVSDPRARAPMWDAFIKRIFDEDQNLIAFLRRAVGYTLTGETMEKCLFFLYGPEGDNGKSTFIETLRALLGEYATKTRAEVLMRSISPHKGATPEVVALRGARLVVASELSDRQRFDEAFLKDLTGGIDTIAGRNLYKGPIQFRPTAKFWLYGNHRPQMRSDDDAAWRRIYLVPFQIRIPRAEQDRALPEKLRGELPGILNWALAGLSEFQRMGGLRPPEKVLAAVAEYRSEQDTHGQFFGERCSKEGSAREILSVVYDDYKSWGARAGQGYLSKLKFVGLLQTHGFKLVTGHGNVKMVVGLKLRPRLSIRVKK
jgi:putative DNA primase/helicase